MPFTQFRQIENYKLSYFNYTKEFGESKAGNLRKKNSRKYPEVWRMSFNAGRKRKWTMVDGYNYSKARKKKKWEEHSHEEM